MKSPIVLLVFLAFASASCKKDDLLKNNCSPDIVFQGKYLGEGCWSVIQVIKPSPEEIGLEPAGTQWVQSLSSNHDTTYHGVVGAGPIPEIYRNGEIFYFTVSKLDSNIIHTMECTVPKYYFTINTISFSKPNPCSK